MKLAGSAGAIVAAAPIVALAWKWQLGVRRVTAGLVVIVAVASAIVLAAGAGFDLAAGVRALLGALITVALSAAILSYRFYRDPERTPPSGDDLVLSPADGEVVYVKRSREGRVPIASKHGAQVALEELTGTKAHDGEALVVGIGMSFLDVHVNRAPIAGRVRLRRHFPGRFGSLRRPEMVFENERATTIIAGPSLEVAVVQIASRLVRQIAGFVREGDDVARGQRIGVIRLGSQVDVVLPSRTDLRVLVAPGDRVKAGTSILAALDSSAPAQQRSGVRRSTAPVTASDRGAPGALVVGTDLRALAVARSLGRRDIDVWLLDDSGEDRVATSSRYVRKVLRSAAGSNEQPLDGLLAMADGHGLRGWTLFATRDESVAALARMHERLATTFTLSCPPWEILRHAYHKRLAYQLAERAGVEHPWTRYPQTQDEVAALECEFPVVLKPDVKERENAFTHDKAWRVDDRDSLLRAWQLASALVGADAVMVQELIPGSGEAQFSYAALCWEGSVLASLVARRTRQYPRDFGHSSSLVETVDEPAVEERGRAIVEALRWSGLVEVELKRDARDGSYKLLDINGRVWTWHGLGAQAGVDFPYLAWRLAQGMPVTPVRGRPGVRWVRVATDVPSALGAVAAGELSLRDWINSLRGPHTWALFAADDPLPSVLEPARLARRLIRRSSKPSVWVLA